MVAVVLPLYAYRVAQSDGTVDTWSVRADGTGQPALVIPTGESIVPVARA